MFKIFLVWIKTHVLAGHVVIMGIFENSAVFGQDPDPDYDHIVPVTGWGSNHPLTDLSYYSDDVIYFSDNGLYTPDGTDPVYDMSFTLSAFAQSRKNCDKSSAGVYCINGSPTKNDPNFGIAVTGLQDKNGDCLPTRVDADKNYESPEIKDGSNTRPSTQPMVLTVTVSSLTIGTSYNLYQYNDFSKVPTSKFNSGSSGATNTYAFTATATTYQQVVNIKSSDLAIFRAVAASAP